MAEGVNNIGFKAGYLIPFNQVKNSETMRNIGAETSKYMTSPNASEITKDGIAVNIDDNRAKEYEAVIAKYGVNIQKYDAEIKPNSHLEEASYEFMARTLYPNEATQKLEAYRNLDRKGKDAEFKKLYTEFKKSEHSVEHNMQLQKTKLVPTGSPIIKFVDKTGNQFMAREVKLQNGYNCIAVANQQNPSQVMLMNKEEFAKYLQEIAPKVQDKN